MTTFARANDVGCAGWRGGCSLLSSPKDGKARSWLLRLQVALEGILYAIKVQKSVRFVFLVAFLLLFLGFLFPLSPSDRLLLFFAVMFLLFAEFVNTAVELTVDLASDSYHPLAKGAKDVSAGAAFFAAVLVAVAAYFTLFEFLAPLLRGLIDGARHLSPLFALIILGLVGFLTLLMARLRRGASLWERMPSGRAAFAFAVGTIITFSTESPLLMLLSYALAGLVSQFPEDIHSRVRVILGAILGITTTMLIFQVLR